MYLDIATLVQRLCDVTTCHPSFVAKAMEKVPRLLIPHPHHFFGSAKDSHLDQAKIIPRCFPFHMNSQHRFFVLASIPLGIHAKDIRVASSTTFMSIILHALDKYLRYQMFNLFSNLVMS